MSYQYRILKDFPVAAFPLNPGETGSFVDTSGNAVASTIYGTIPERPPLVVGGGSSRLVSTSNGFSVASFNPSAKDSFSIEIWFKPVAPGYIQIVGHNGTDDGITWDGEALRFATLHGTAGRAEAIYYPPDFNDAWCLEAVHTRQKNQLYVNGLLVAEVDITDAQLTAGFSTSGGYYVGKAITGTPTGRVDALAFYLWPLDAETCAAHYLWGISVNGMTGIVSERGGYYWTMNDSETSILFREDYPSTYAWESGVTNGVNFSDGYLRPKIEDTGLTVSSNWSTGIVLGGIATTIDGSKIEWNGDGNFTIEASLNDGTSWTTCVNGQEIPGISENFTTSGKSLTIRVTFPAGEASTTLSKVRSLSLVFYNRRDFIGNTLTRTMTVNGNVAIDSLENEPIQNNDNWGTRFYNGNAVVSADANGEVARTIEVWFKVNTLPASAKSIIDTRATGSTGNTAVTLNGGTFGTINTAGTSYLNGAVLSGTITANQWSHYVIVLPANVTTPITFASDYLKSNVTDITFGLIAVYPTAFTATDVANLYNSYFGAGLNAINDQSIATVSEFSPAVKMYNPGWSLDTA